MNIARTALLVLLLGTLLLPAANALPDQKFAAGPFQVLQVQSNGQLFVWGSDSDGQIGLSIRPETQGTAAQVPGVSDAEHVCAGNSHSCYRSTGGGVKCTGDDYYGQLGDGEDPIRQLEFTAVSGLGESGVARVGCGYFHTCVILDSGKPQCFGKNDDGRIGDGQKVREVTVPTDIAVTTGAAFAAGGHHFNCLLMTAGSVQCVGGNALGQLGEALRPRARPLSTYVVWFIGAFYSFSYFLLFCLRGAYKKNVQLLTQI
jgi:alpha-tubulin suppressor-like RCC1 family protein